MFVMLLFCFLVFQIRDHWYYLCAVFSWDLSSMQSVALCIPSSWMDFRAVTFLGSGFQKLRFKRLESRLVSRPGKPAVDRPTQLRS